MRRRRGAPAAGDAGGLNRRDGAPTCRHRRLRRWRASRRAGPVAAGRPGRDLRNGSPIRGRGRRLPLAAHGPACQALWRLGLLQAACARHAGRASARRDRAQGRAVWTWTCVTRTSIRASSGIGMQRGALFVFAAPGHRGRTGTCVLQRLRHRRTGLRWRAPARMRRGRWHSGYDLVVVADGSLGLRARSAMRIDRHTRGARCGACCRKATAMATRIAPALSAAWQMAGMLPVGTTPTTRCAS